MQKQPNEDETAIHLGVDSIMKIIMNEKYQMDQETIVVLGNFDGIHRGHQSLLEMARQEKAKTNRAVLVFTFQSHPSHDLPGREAIRYLFSNQQRIEIFESLGVDTMYSIPFSNVKNMPPSRFVEEILLTHLKASTIVIGHDFRFGAGAKGNVALLKSICSNAGVKVVVVGKKSFGEERISSTRIRDAISAGNLLEAEHLLGRPYQLSGHVIHGKKLGRKMGIPTANLEMRLPYVVPKFGVYFSQVLVEGQAYYAVTSIGLNPTVDQRIHPSIEIHILDFNKEIYHTQVRLNLFQLLREEKKFSTLDELIHQIHQDIKQVREMVYKLRDL
jgi:riboflavin kinase/FMN adenylyltransferase